MILRDLGEEEALYRIIAPRWSHAPTSGAGAALKGGRFNRPGLEALYLSQTVETAIEEYRQHARLLPPGIITTFLVSRLRVVDFSGGYAAGTWDPTNLVLFNSSSIRAEALRVYDPQRRLPRDDRSWSTDPD